MFHKGLNRMALVQLQPTRRRFLREGGALLLSIALPVDAPAEEATMASVVNPTATPFDRATVVNLARELALSEFVPASDDLPPVLADLTYDQYRDIRFNRDRAIWAGTDLPFQLQLFHRGFYFRNRIDVSIVTGGEARPLAYARDLFTFGERVPRPLPDADIGFSGVRLHHPINRLDTFDEVAVFQGASYFRSLGRDQAYGLSARGLALKTAAQEGEEFPVFQRFWVETPGEEDATIVVHALLDSDSVAGAYRFSIRPGKSTIMDVEATLFPRVALTGVGLAPGTSMFFFGPNGRKDVDDYRPEVHDSDGLLMANGRGEILWRPLANPSTLQTSAFIDSAPRGFGLIQRNNEFDSYQDIEAGYERRPSLWVEPIGDWGKGAVVLVEIPTVSEIHDNIVAYWAPREPIPAGVEYGFAYRLYWGGEPELAASAARVKATRSGRASISGPSPVRLFVIDYEATDPQHVPEAITPEATVSASAGKVDKVVVMRVPGNNGWRLAFQLDPDEADSAELRASLTFEDGRQAETWVYRWTA